MWARPPGGSAPRQTAAGSASPTDEINSLARVSIPRTRALSSALSDKLAASADFSWAVREAAEILVRLFHPMMPHLAEECWQVLGNEHLVAETPWPVVDRSLLVEDAITLPVQVIDAANCAAWNVPFEARPSPEWDTAIAEFRSFLSD